MLNLKIVAPTYSFLMLNLKIVAPTYSFEFLSSGF